METTIALLINLGLVGYGLGAIAGVTCLRSDKLTNVFSFGLASLAALAALCGSGLALFNGVHLVPVDLGHSFLP